MKIIVVFFLMMLSAGSLYAQEQSWIRINQLGYTPNGKKNAVWVSKGDVVPSAIFLKRADSDELVLEIPVDRSYGAYGPFLNSARVNFSQITDEGRYYLSDGSVNSSIFTIHQDVYAGGADFLLRYMRQQRTLFNPFLQDSCHTHDGFTMYAGVVGIPDSTHIDAGGGWHDASDYLQYSTTSANATYHLLAAYRDFKSVFDDTKQANGLEGNNGIADVLDEAKWGLDWLLKMHPEPHLMFNQIADDRDHAGIRMPGEDDFYGRGYERPVYFIDGNPQQRGDFLNNTTGTSSTAAKFTSAFSLGSKLFKDTDLSYSTLLKGKAKTAYAYALQKPGVTQTVSVKSPYIYAEDNWVDDMELASVAMFKETGEESYIAEAMQYAKEEKVTPWMIRDTANHYQYYPFINLGHYELAKNTTGVQREEVISYYRDGIEHVWQRARENAFYRGVPFIWCSNNLTTAFAIQCYWYRELTGDTQFEELEQANFDWLFGINPWGVSMVYGYPQGGNTPKDPHSAFTHLHGLPIDGGLVDGPVYSTIYDNLIGIQLYNEDKYAEFQSELVVYHDDFGDYSTNEPTMDGTATLIYLMAAKEYEAKVPVKDKYGAIVQGDSSKQNVALVFTGDEFDDGLITIQKSLDKHGVKGSFFVTGRFLGLDGAGSTLYAMYQNGHYIGPHSDQHLLYCDWDNRDSLLVNEKEFKADLNDNIKKLRGIGIGEMTYFLPSYEWYNKEIVDWAHQEKMKTVNFTPGLRTAADYTYPAMGSRYMRSRDILQQLYDYESKRGLNGQIILIHIGTDARRKDKLYSELDGLIKKLKSKNYNFVVLQDL